MDIERLRQLAFPLRDLLANHNHRVKHGQALDLIASVAGLRSWPEANAFPARLASVAVDDTAAERLARRIQTISGLALPAQTLLQLLQTGVILPQLSVWPEGPTAGIYVCLDESHAKAAIARYVASSGETLFYTEGIGFDSESAIELGENGIFSGGLTRVASGTLVVAGPIELTQESWESNKSRMIAASNAADANLRVVLVCVTPDPANLHRDLALLLRMEEPAGFVDHTLAGIVTSEGHLERVDPFVPASAKPRPALKLPAPDHPLPPLVADELARVLAVKSTGYLIASGEPRGLGRMEAIASVLPFLVHLGPVGFITPHFRGTYGRERPTPAPVAALPQYPSIESAAMDGIRSMVVDWPDRETLAVMAGYADRVCFIMGGNSLGVGRAYSERFLGNDTEGGRALDDLVAVICRSTVEGEADGHEMWDMWVHVPHLGAQTSGRRKKPLEPDVLLEESRIIRWEDHVLTLLAQGVVKRATVRKQFPYLRIPRGTGQVSGTPAVADTQGPSGGQSTVPTKVSTRKSH